MSGWTQGWLVARREVRERSRSRAFWVSIILTIVAVAGLIILPAVISTGGTTKHVGLTGSTPEQLAATIQVQGHRVGMNLRISRYDTLAAGEQAVRDKHIDVLVIDTQRLAWPRRADEKLKAVVIGAMQVDAIRTRATAAGISPTGLSTLLAPVPVQNQELGAAPGRSPGDETVALVTAGLLMICIATFGALVLSGVVEEKASRVVEVLLTRVSARNLLAGKIAGIGLLGLVQIALVVVVALIARSAISSVDLPAVRASVAVWVLVWFVLGYALYATTFGALGSLASRVEDAQTVAGPVTVLLVAAFFVSNAAIGSPTTMWARVISLIPITAPFAMPGRIAMGVTAWWEPTLAVALTLATIAALVYFGGRLYIRAVLHSGATLSLAEAWRRTAASDRKPLAAEATQHRPWLNKARDLREETPAPTRPGHGDHPLLFTILICAGLAVGALVALLANDVIIGVAVGGLFVGLITRVTRMWTGQGRAL